LMVHAEGGGVAAVDAVVTVIDAKKGE
jgi:hypothetical protein